MKFYTEPSKDGEATLVKVQKFDQLGNLDGKAIVNIFTGTNYKTDADRFCEVMNAAYKSFWQPIDEAATREKIVQACYKELYCNEEDGFDGESVDGVVNFVLKKHKELSITPPRKIITGQWAINYKWFLEFILHDDCTVTVEKHYRIHGKYDEKFPQETEGFSAEIVEDNKRTITHLIVNNEKMRVRNPKNIFEYGVPEGE